MPNPFPDAIISYTVKPAVDRLIDLGDLPRPPGAPQLLPEGILFSDIEKAAKNRPFLEYGDGLLSNQKVKIPISELREAAGLSPTGRVIITTNYRIPELERITDPNEQDRFFLKRMEEAGKKRVFGVTKRPRKG